MKKMLFLCAAILITGGSFAQTDVGKRTNNKTIIINSLITDIILNDGVNLVLLNDATDSVSIEGKKAFVDAVNFSFTGTELTISSNIADRPVLVSLSARLLSNLTINGNSIVGSYQVLQNKELSLLLNGNCRLAIRTAGILNINAAEDFYYTYESRKITN